MVVPPENPVAFVSALEDFINHPEKQKEYKIRSGTAAPLYSREKQAKDYINALEEVGSL